MSGFGAGPSKAYARQRTPVMRTNEGWLSDLRAGGATQAAALEALRSYLLRALPGSLRRYGEVPEDVIEDVVQDSLVRTLAHLDRFEGRSRFTTWATTIAVRVAMTELRRRRWRDVSLDDVTVDARSELPAIADPKSDPEGRAARRGILDALATLVETALSERQRTAIVAELRGMPQEEIGRRLGLSRNAVYKLTHDARKKLRRGLEDAGLDAAEIRSAFEAAGRS